VEFQLVLVGELTTLSLVSLSPLSLPIADNLRATSLWSRCMPPSLKGLSLEATLALLATLPATAAEESYRLSSDEATNMELIATMEHKTMRITLMETYAVNMPVLLL